MLVARFQALVTERIATVRPGRSPLVARRSNRHRVRVADPRAIGRLSAVSSGRVPAAVEDDPSMAGRRVACGGLLTGRDPYRQIPIRSYVPGTGEEVSGTKARLEIWPYGSLVAQRGRHKPVGSTPSSMSENASSLSARYVSQDCRSQTSTRLLAPMTTNSRPSPA
jgi:hypothetical protein